MNRNLAYLKHVLIMLVVLLTMQPVQVRAAFENIEFSSLTNRDGLSNSQVGAILCSVILSMNFSKIIMAISGCILLPAIAFIITIPSSSTVSLRSGSRASR